MQTWKSKPISLAIDKAHLNRLDLAFRGVYRDSGSFVVFVFLGADVPADAGRDHPRFAAAFSVFAHTGCWGDEGHCDWHQPPVSPFDQRPEHHLTPITVVIDITEAGKQLPSLDPFIVTIHAAKLGDPKASANVFRFDELTALAYQ